MASINPAVAISFETVETVVLRKREDRTPLEYRDTRETVRLRRHLAEINEALSSVEIAHPALGIIRTGSPTRIGNANPGPARRTLCRMFSGSFSQGGRFYGAFWIGMKSVERVRLTVGGQEVVEHDYRAIHPTLLYAQCGAAFDGDPYEIPGYPPEVRKLIKVAFLVMVNARDAERAFLSVMQKARALTESNTIPHGYRSSQAIHALLDAIENRHAPIRKAFYSDAGIRLQRLDSNIAENVLLDLVRKNIAALPVHDSFITALQHSQQLEEAMDKALKTAIRTLDADTISFCRVSPCNEKRIDPTVSHIERVPQSTTEPEPSSLALAWFVTTQMGPEEGLALVLGVSGFFNNLERRPAQIEAVAA